MDIQTFVDTYRINQTLLAEVIGVSKSVFSNKLREKNGQRFTEDQKDKLKKFIDRFITDAKKVSI